ncbi:hypothetical protein BCR32DRAFT_251997, partial [Anaeromyces robustus]
MVRELSRELIFFNMISDSNMPPLLLRRGLRCFGNNMDKYFLLFIHELNSWTEKQLNEFLLLHLHNYHSLIQSVKRFFNPVNGSYFIIRINALENLNTLEHIFPIVRCLNLKKIVNWIYCDGTENNNNRNPNNTTSKRKKIQYP